MQRVQGRRSAKVENGAESARERGKSRRRLKGAGKDIEGWLPRAP